MASTAVRSQVGNLPAETTSFVGRRREVAEARRLLRRHRLVTLTGAAGIGKTRLALRVVAQVREAFRDGVWLVELAALPEDQLLIQAVADALGVHDQSPRPLADSLLDYLEDKQLLLVLDCCEHMVDACSVLADRLLRTAREVRILATSREALRAPGECLLEVPPLPAPDPRQATTAAARSDAVRLFAQRATAALPGFRVHAGNRGWIARLCHRLDGIPLGIELAALRVRALPPERILSQLNDYFGMLAGASQVAIPRLQTLQTTIEWSFGLCSPQEQALWAKASVFSGGFDLDTAEAVCSGEGLARDDVLDLVVALVEKSVLSRAEGGARVRYRMLDAIHQYGWQRLVESGHRVAVQIRHRDHFRALATGAGKRWLMANQPDALTDLRQEYPNLRAAMEFCLHEPGQARAGLDVAITLWRYWILSGWIGEGRYWLNRMLEINPEPSTARANALWISAWLALLHGETPAAEAQAAESLALAEQLGDAHAQAHALRTRGLAVFCGEDAGLSVPLLEDALDRHRDLHDRDGVWTDLLHLTLVSATLGQTERALAFGRECLALARMRDARVSTSYALWALGLAKWLAGDRRGAESLLRQGISHPSHALGNSWGMAHCLEMLAWTAADERPVRAATLLGAAHTVWRTAGASPDNHPHLAASHARCDQGVRQALGEAEFAAAFAEGASLSLDEALAYARYPAA
ncbi:ATP-binding protein [Gandjariella thermophila]|uniref:LuxR family transcriptional regulator n=1 Tax=Gandjariella thermophila TaxID=1931992 RepID=A0A4D4JIJ5_9PSEU|nr:AAA family ATPase [Gandjariella thermophila]GDY33713.1 LuxR family transcriptional regulator [Gandjariella thermophila]